MTTAKMEPRTFVFETVEPVGKPYTGDGSDGASACARCGAKVKNPRYWVHLINGGSTALHVDDEKIYTPDGGDLGAYAVGSECRKAFPAGFLYDDKKSTPSDSHPGSTAQEAR